MRQVTHALLTRPPLSHLLVRKLQGASLDLHVLSTPPAFILSQDQTLMFKFVSSQNRLALLEHLALVFSTLTCDTYLTLGENELPAKFEPSNQINFLLLLL